MGGRNRFFVYMLIGAAFFGINNCTTQPSCKVDENGAFVCTRTMKVDSTAYTSRIRRRHAGYPRGAWGDVLKPDIKALAVSDDLVAMGLTHGTKVKVEGLEGEYIVMDKMHPKWRKMIDVYTGNDYKKARFWGRRKVNIGW